MTTPTPSTPEALRNSEISDLDLLTISPIRDTSREELVPNTPDYHTKDPPKALPPGNKEDIDGSQAEVGRLSCDMELTGNCHFH